MAANDRIRRGLQEMEETGSTSTANMASTGRLAAMAGLGVSLHSVKMHRHKAKNPVVPSRPLAWGERGGLGSTSTAANNGNLRVLLY